MTARKQTFLSKIITFLLTKKYFLCIKGQCDSIKCVSGSEPTENDQLNLQLPLELNSEF